MKRYSYLVAGIVMLALSGCTANTSHFDNIDASVQACIDQGGIPIMSGWDDTMQRCDFPPQ